MDKKYKKERRSYRKKLFKSYLGDHSSFFAAREHRKQDKLRQEDIRTNHQPDINTLTEHVALVLNGEIVEIVHCQPKLAAILLSEPKAIAIPKNVIPKIGWRYVENEFVVGEPTYLKDIDS